MTGPLFRIMGLWSRQTAWLLVGLLQPGLQFLQTHFRAVRGIRNSCGDQIAVIAKREGLHPEFHVVRNI